VHCARTPSRTPPILPGFARPSLPPEHGSEAPLDRQGLVPADDPSGGRAFQSADPLAPPTAVAATACSARAPFLWHQFAPVRRADVPGVPPRRARSGTRRAAIGALVPAAIGSPCARLPITLAGQHIVRVVSTRHHPATRTRQPTAAPEGAGGASRTLVSIMRVVAAAPARRLVVRDGSVGPPVYPGRPGHRQPAVHATRLSVDRLGVDDNARSSAHVSFLRHLGHRGCAWLGAACNRR
jgi:hypothetical protein